MPVSSREQSQAVLYKKNDGNGSNACWSTGSARE